MEHFRPTAVQDQGQARLNEDGRCYLQCSVQRLPQFITWRNYQTVGGQVKRASCQGQRFHSQAAEKLPDRRVQVSYHRSCCYWEQHSQLGQCQEIIAAIGFEYDRDKGSYSYQVNPSQLQPPSSGEPHPPKCVGPSPVSFSQPLITEEEGELAEVEGWGGISDHFHMSLLHLIEQ